MSDFHTKTVETSALDPKEHPPQKPAIAMLLDALMSVEQLAVEAGADIQEALLNFIATIDRRKADRPWTIEDHRARRKAKDEAA